MSGGKTRYMSTRGRMTGPDYDTKMSGVHEKRDRLIGWWSLGARLAEGGRSHDEDINLYRKTVLIDPMRTDTAVT